VVSYLGRMEAVQYVGSGIPAKEHLGKAVSPSREIGDRPGEAFSLLNLGLNEWYAGNPVQSVKLLQRSLDLLVELGDRTLSLRPMFCLGAIAFERGDVAEARQRWKQAIAHSSELRDTWTLAFELDCFAALAAHESQPERAITLLGAAEMIRSRYAVAWPPPWRAKIEHWVEPARIELGTLSDRAIAQGRSMTLGADRLRDGGAVTITPVWTGLNQPTSRLAS
jgi:hypothetical protein